ncbi:hypothetical protein FACS189425_02290 [Clostridia bacterium]|nr:hypothetical protein FACS189425_02290 [Clostridia bacterium]
MRIDAKKVKRFVLLNLPYALLFWLFDKCGEAYRLSPGNGVLKKLISMAAHLNFSPSPWLSLVPFDLLVGLIGAAAVYLAVLYRKHSRKKWRKEVLCYKGRKWTTPTKPCSHGVCGTNGRTGKVA